MRFLEKISFRKTKVIFLILIIVLPILYGGGYIGQFIKNYNIWSLKGGVLGDGTSPDFPKGEFLYCIIQTFSKEGFIGLGIECIVIGVLILFIMNIGKGEQIEYDRERNIKYSYKGTYGTSGYMTKKEMKDLLNIGDIKNTDGTILGIVDKNVVSIPIKTRMNKNIAVFGASGSMKSRAFVRNMIIQSALRGESMVLTDPKSELYEDMSLYLENKGYKICVFNLVNPQNSDSWNCLNEIEHEELMAQTCADVIIKNTSGGKTDHFWDMSELNLLKALILYVDTEMNENRRNLGQVYKMIAELNEKELDERFNILPNHHPAKGPYNIFKQAGEKVRGGVIIGLGARLQVFQNEAIRNVTSYNEIDLVKAGTEKCAYFCITSDQDSTFDFLSSLFFSFLFIKLVRYADQKGINGSLPIPVNFILDEFHNIGAIPDFKKKISTVRSRNISISLIFQNLAQLKNRYPNDEWQEILGNCDTQIALGCTDEMTAKFISERTGEITVEIGTQSRQLSTWRISNYTPDYRETSSVAKRKLLTSDEVLRMPLDEALIILRGQKVFKVKKFDYTKHYESKKLQKRKVSDYIPKWRVNYNQPVFVKENTVLETTTEDILYEIKKETAKEDTLYEIKKETIKEDINIPTVKTAKSISKKSLMTK